MMTEIVQGHIDFSAYPNFVGNNLDRLPQICCFAGITLRELSETTNVPIDDMSKYIMRKKFPCRSRYNRIANVLGLQKWRSNWRCG